MSETLYKNNMKYTIAHYGTILGSILSIVGLPVIHNSNKIVLCMILPLFIALVLYCIYSSYCIYNRYGDRYGDRSDSESGSDSESVSSDPSIESDSDKNELDSDFKYAIVSQNLLLSDYYKKFK